MRIDIIKLTAADDDFAVKFEPYREAFFEILARSYPTYHGHDYQLIRLREGKCTLYLASADGAVVGASYIKANLRRGGTAVYPETYRRFGIAELLTRRSLQDFPCQYTILNSENVKMLSLMRKVGFRKATSVAEVSQITKGDFQNLSDFRMEGEFLVFKRQSLRRGVERDKLTLLHTFT